MDRKRLKQLGVPVGVVLIVVMLVVPMPAALLDLLLVVNLTTSILVLMVAMFVRKPLDFAAFPAILLVMTLFRLALNVSATRWCSPRPTPARSSRRSATSSSAARSSSA